MLPLLAVFVLWLALTGRLSVYSELMKTGPGFGSSLGIAPGPHSGLTGPTTGPFIRNPTPAGKGPLDWFWNKIGLGPPPVSTTPTTPNPGSGTQN